MNLTRREFVAAAAGLFAAGDGDTRLGVAAYSFHVRLAAERAARKSGLADPLVLLDHCHGLGAGGIQTGLGVRDAAYLAALRKKADGHGMFLEGQISLPRDPAGVERFTAEVRTAKDAGVTVLRSVLLGGRRYETFDTAAAFRQWADRAYRSLTLVEPILARHGVRLAFENHKDYRASEVVPVLQRLGSRFVGICVDTGNNLALLEDPHETVAALALWAVTVHLKDMAVAEDADGFLLSEVPLGEGILDLPKVVAVLKQAQPGIRFNLEMITRDPLKIPCLTDKYWATFADVPGRDLARTLALVRRCAAKALPRTSHLPREQQIAAEEENVRKCLAYARRLEL
jgi:3-oxoisoapionate decarboxylase